MTLAALIVFPNVLWGEQTWGYRSAWIRTQEAAYGEIARIGNQDDLTLGSFHYLDPAHPRPEIEAGLEVLPQDAPEHDGELCRGEVYIEGDLTHVVVFRP